jgi:hypothetical protein
MDKHVPENRPWGMRVPTSKNQLLLRCPLCKRERMVTRQIGDYPEAVRMEIQCDRCNTGDFDEVMYYDAGGKHITRDTSEAAPPAETKAEHR